MDDGEAEWDAPIDVSILYQYPNVCFGTGRLYSRQGWHVWGIQMPAINRGNHSSGAKARRAFGAWIELYIGGFNDYLSCACTSSLNFASVSEQPAGVSHTQLSTGSRGLHNSDRMRINHIYARQALTLVRIPMSPILSVPMWGPKTTSSSLSIRQCGRNKRHLCLYPS